MANKSTAIAAIAVTVVDRMIDGLECPADDKAIIKTLACILYGVYSHLSFFWRICKQRLSVTLGRRLPTGVHEH